MSRQYPLALVCFVGAFQICSWAVGASTMLYLSGVDFRSDPEFWAARIQVIEYIRLALSCFAAFATGAYIVRMFVVVAAIVVFLVLPIWDFYTWHVHTEGFTVEYSYLEHLGASVGMWVGVIVATLFGLTTGAFIARKFGNNTNAV